MEGDNEYYRWEVRQLREELHLLRDRNHQLTQDNIRLSEHVRDLDDKRGIYKSMPSECRFYIKIAFLFRISGLKLGNLNVKSNHLDRQIMS